MSLIKDQGFTLIELVVVVAILAILITIVSISIDAPRRLAETNDLRRASDIRSIVTAVHTYTIDHKGSIPPGITTTEQQIGNSVTGCVNLNRGCGALTNACLDLTETFADYLHPIPKDPKLGSFAKTGYTISISDKDMVTVKACGAQGKEEIVMSL